jgi:1,6-anhydro-N-acetylmuramate kinase
MSIIHTYKVPQSLNNNIETYQYTDHQTTIDKNLIKHAQTIFHRIKSHNSGSTKIRIVKNVFILLGKVEVSVVSVAMFTIH